MAWNLGHIPEGAETEEPFNPDTEGWNEEQRLWHQSFAYFDALPRKVRRTLWDLAVTFEPGPIAAFLARQREEFGMSTRKAAINHVVTSLRMAELADIKNFGLVYQGVCGTSLPHLAAHASVMRYVNATKPRGRHMRQTHGE